MKTLKYSKEFLEPIVKNSKTFSNVVRKITNNEKVHGGMVAYVKSLLQFYEIDYTHFIGSGWSKGTKGQSFTKMTKEHLFKHYLTDKPSKKTCNNNIKNWLFDLDIKKKECEICLIGNTWNGKELILQMDHLDGDNLNNKIENLRIVCPNCHSQTHNYAGRKNKR